MNKIADDICSLTFSIDHHRSWYPVNKNQEKLYLF